MGYSVHAGNGHDSQAFPKLFAQIKDFQPTYLIADSGYKTPAIARFLLQENITSVFPNTRPRGKKGKLRPKDFIYDDYYDVYLCPENQILTYRTTIRDGYRDYKSDPKICVTCPLLSLCTESRDQQKVVTRHVWKDALEVCEDIWHKRGMKERYQKRKETIERLFGTAKEYHNLRHTRQIGKAKMQDKLGLALACLNLKKYTKIMARKAFLFCSNGLLSHIFTILENEKRQTRTKSRVCLRSGLDFKDFCRIGVSIRIRVQTDYLDAIMW